ncbi:MAG: cupredoxin family copper-binding protein [Bacteroidetes bacterium]|nr:cupredoxin family copper-binding protein [Bacteroidota bacterium]
MKTKLVSLFILLGVIGLGYGCGKSHSNPMPTNGAPSMAATVNIQNFAFSPAAVHVLPGGTVTWTNKDSAPHTATDLNGAFDSSTLNTGQSFKFTFNHPGTYTYHCVIHSMMANATIIVGN